MFPKLFVTDLDGTALDKSFQPYARFPDHFSQFLDDLHEKKCEWAISTTWDVVGQSQLVLSSTVKSKPLFLMAEYGMRLAKYTGAEPEYIQPFTNNMEQKVAQFNSDFAFAIVRDICTRFSPEVMHFYGHMLSFKPIAEDEVAFRAYIKEHAVAWHESNQFNFSLNSASSFSIYPRFLNKGAALSEALEQSAIAPEDVVIAGDEIADIAMMQPDLATFAVCPENAAQEVKDHVTNMGCFVGCGIGALGIIDSFKQLANKQQWTF
ncbi:MAG: HAD hydrolase family protein [Victivallaceae bacterium]|nr:HAD hydrolase family protein [Victivallaceae bacterium]